MAGQDTNEIKKEIEKLEALMQSPLFWDDKVRAQNVLKELALMKEKKEGIGRYDRGNAIVTIVSGAGGNDAEDFSRLLRLGERSDSQKKSCQSPDGGSSVHWFHSRR